MKLKVTFTLPSDVPITSSEQELQSYLRLLLTVPASCYHMRTAIGYATKALNAKDAHSMSELLAKGEAQEQLCGLVESIAFTIEVVEPTQDGNS
jgi:hypothetical protein